jgi:acyl-CoA hydrolase/GNAT superfamily N-acetyltransferase
MTKDSLKYYEERQTTAEEAVNIIRSGQRILVGSGCSVPQEVLRALVARADELADVEFVHLMTFGIAPYVDEKYEGSFRHNAFFIGGNVRHSVGEGRADYTPIFLSEIPELLSSGQMRLDVVLATVTPPDRFGYCSLGIHPDLMKVGIDTAPVVIAQVNSHMPLTHGDTFVHVSDIDYFVLHDEPILELPDKPFDETSVAIARHVASLIENGSTLQLGIGNIPNAILSLLGNHRDLGIHSEMVSNGVIDLCEGGVITNKRKGLHPGKAVASFAMGTKILYDYLDDNPFWEFRPTEYVNSPRIIAQNYRMVSINSAIQIDITGQVCADSIGSTLYSGIGGQVDFVRGAAMSPEGKPVIALPATAKGGKVSRIVSELDQGAGVVTSRGDVHYVATEYGVAYIHGKTIRERAMALIEIAHPDFRPELRDIAVGRHYVPVEWELPSEASRYPVEMEEHHDFKEKNLFVRPLRSADADRLMEFFYSHSPETIHGRYRYPKKSLPRNEAMRMCTLDYTRRFAIAVFGEGEKKRHIVAIGRYHLNERTQFAETAIVIHEQYRRLGIASYLLKQLRKHAETNSILGFYGESSPGNKATIALHRAVGHPVIFDPEADMYKYTLKFDENPVEPHSKSGD